MDLRTRTSASFDQMLERWEQRYASKAVEPLAEIARNEKSPDAHRYVAVMGLARLAGRPAAPVILPLLKDASWMVRSSSLQALRALDASEWGTQALPLLKDPALAVRAEAALTVAKLNPPGAVEALLSAIEDPANYHGGKAQWVPHKALDGLVTLQAPASVAGRLRKLLDRSGDSLLLEKTVETLEKLRASRNADSDLVQLPYRPERPFKEKLAYWRTNLKAQ
jgi:HEAT repeat protein